MNSTSVNTNLAALNAQRSLQGSSGQLSLSLQRLSSGLRLNSARDDAAGMAIATRMTTQVRGLEQGVRNIADGISLAQTAEGGLESIVANVQRIRELAVQAANFTNTSEDRAALQLEVAQLKEEITRVGNQTSFNGVKLLNGGFQSAVFQAGANIGEFITISKLLDARANAIGAGVQSVLSWTQAVTAGPSSVQQVQLGAGAPVPLGVMQHDAKLLASAINTVGAANIPGLSATAAANVRDGTVALASSTDTNYNFQLNGRAITIAVTANAAVNRSNAVAAINAESALTGVVATDLGSGVRLTEAGGGNIRLAESVAFSSSYAGLGGLVSADGLGASITISYAVPPNSSASQLVFSGTGMSVQTFATPEYIPISSVNLSTVEGANKALAAADAAITALSQSRAALGAAMNRFEASISAQRIGAEAQTASRSRIRDADFASETAALTRAQILQQSGVAILAQANTIPKNVLALLR